MNHGLCDFSICVAYRFRDYNALDSIELEMRIFFSHLIFYEYSTFYMGITAKDHE